MAVIEATNDPRPVVRVRGSFYVGMAIAMSAVVFLGFGPSFYMNAYVGEALGLPSAATLSPIIVIHGIAFSAWMIVLVVQTSLIATARHRWHRRLGIAGGLLAAAMLALGLAAQTASMRRDLASVPFEQLPPFVRGAMFSGLVSLPLFAALIGAAIYWRNRPETHKRLVLLATITLLGAATVRLARTIGFVAPALGSFPFLALVLTDAFLVALVVNDVRTRGRLHPATLWGSLAIVAMQVISNSALPHTAIVGQLMQSIAG